MNILPLFPNIIVERLKAEDTVGGIYVPNNKEESMRGLVLAVFDGCDLPVGSKIIYARLSGDPIKWDEKDCLIMAYDRENVLATYETTESTS